MGDRRAKLFGRPAVHNQPWVPDPLDEGAERWVDLDAQELRGLRNGIEDGTCRTADTGSQLDHRPRGLYLGKLHDSTLEKA